MTKKEYREAYRLTDREKAQVWNEVRAPLARQPHRPRRWLPALGGLAGVLVTPITTLNYDVGVLLGLKGFAAAILGGFGSFPGAILGGLGLGLLESLSAGYSTRSCCQGIVATS